MAHKDGRLGNSLLSPWQETTGYISKKGNLQAYLLTVAPPSHGLFFYHFDLSRFLLSLYIL